MLKLLAKEGRMQKWDYCLVQLTYPNSRRARAGKVSIRMKDCSEEYELDGNVEFFDIIVRLGEDGWDAVDSNSHFGITQYIFKRPNQDVIQVKEPQSAREIPPELLREITERENDLREKILDSYAPDK
jgi:hypothetical protein